MGKRDWFAFEYVCACANGTGHTHTHTYPTDEPSRLLLSIKFILFIAELWWHSFDILMRLSWNKFPVNSYATTIFNGIVVGWRARACGQPVHHWQFVYHSWLYCLMLMLLFLYIERHLHAAEHLATQWKTNDIRQIYHFISAYLKCIYSATLWKMQSCASTINLKE